MVDYSAQVSEVRRREWRERGFLFGVAIEGYKKRAAEADLWCQANCRGGFGRTYYTEDWDNPDVVAQVFTYRPDAEAFLVAFSPGTLFDLHAASAASLV